MKREDIQFNANDDMVIYPSEEGWNRIVVNTMQYYGVERKTATEWVDAKRTDDGGYIDQVAHVMCVLGTMFYTGTDLISSPKMVLKRNE